MTKNIIFLDTEFTDLNPRVGELLSIGLVKMTGEELYLELKYKNKVHPWVKKKVLPFLKNKKISRGEAVKKIEKFIGKPTKQKDVDGKVRKKKPYLMAYVNQFDAMYWYELFADPKKHPAFWIPIDFASILFSQGYDPECMRKDKFFKDLKIDRSKYNQHNALDDAKLLKEVYLAFMAKITE